MKTARQLLMDGLKAMGADGLCNRDGQCGCGICDLAPLGDCINIEMCEAAKFIKPRSDEHEYWDEYPDGYYTPIQVLYSDTGGAMSNSVDICPFDDDLTCPLDYHTCEIYRERMEEEQ